jgi:alpha-beta hydrolase superfamily lysophospholipase
LLSKFAPGLANNQIDAKLFIPPRTNSKPIRLPRGFEQLKIRTADGNVNGYKTGRGPTVVFVHGWGGGAHQFFPLMRGLSRIGFSSLAFDHLGHGSSDRKPSTLQQSISTCNHVFNRVSKSEDGLCTIIGHATGCIEIANARPSLLKDVPLFLISPVFNYKLYFLKQLIKTGLPADVVKQYANRFSKIYHSDYQKLELGNKLARYGDVTAIAHDQSDRESAAADSINFCNKYPLTRLMITKDTDHTRIINSESVWQELKSHLNYDDTTINFSSDIIGQQ